MKVIPGYDGVYGRLVIFEETGEEEGLVEKVSQRSIVDFM